MLAVRLSDLYKPASDGSVAAITAGGELHQETESVINKQLVSRDVIASATER
jgi:hypothetical protein